MIALPKFDGLRAIASLLYPPVCTICGANVRAGKYLCSHCESKTIRIVAPFCQTCSEPFEGAITGAFTCANCAHRTIHFDAAVAAYRSRGIVRELIHDFKYRRQIYLRHLVARWLCSAMNDERLRARGFNIIIPVPLHPARQRERGFNQNRCWSVSGTRPHKLRSIAPSAWKIYMMPSVYEKTRTCEVCRCC